MKKHLFFLFAIVTMGISLTSCKATATGESGEETDSNSIVGKYTFILYNDNMGEFIAPNGGRICSFRLSGGRREPLNINLSSSVKILGKTTNMLYISSDRLFTDYSDYLSYNSSHNPDKTLGVPIQRKDMEDGECYIASFSEGQIEHKRVSAHSIEPATNVEYTLLYFNDEYGILYDAHGKRICGAEKQYSSGELSVKLSKSVSIFGVTTQEIAINGEKMFTSNTDLIHDNYLRDGEPSPYKASVKRKEEGDATIYMLTKASPSDAVAAQESSSSSSSGSKWNVTSANELKGKLAGTIWTCRPTGRRWYRLVFSSSQMTLYYAEPQMGKWLGGSREGDMYNYSIEETYTADTGEKCVSVQFWDQHDDRVSLGALFFLKGGQVEFSWLRGRYGGKAECKDFNWE